MTPDELFPILMRMNWHYGRGDLIRVDFTSSDSGFGYVVVKPHGMSDERFRFRVITKNGRQYVRFRGHTRALSSAQVRQLTEKEVEFVLECLPEDIPIEGNASAIDDEADAEAEGWIHAQLEQGNMWAWCTVRVVAKWNDFEGEDYLGCCSYESEESFRQGGYFRDMKDAALAALNRNIADKAAAIATLIR